MLPSERESAHVLCVPRKCDALAALLVSNKDTGLPQTGFTQYHGFIGCRDQSKLVRANVQQSPDAAA
jgi:hypothetical protein